MHTYRVRMMDNYMGIYNAESEEDAKKQAIEVVRKLIEGVAMTKGERNLALSVWKVEKVN